MLRVYGTLAHRVRVPVLMGRPSPVAERGRSLRPIL